MLLKSLYLGEKRCVMSTGIRWEAEQLENEWDGEEASKQGSAGP